MNKGDLPIASPCTLDWNRMTPADAGRFCGDCKKVVRDLSALSQREARALLRRERGGELCVRYLHDRDGKVFFAGDAPRAGLVPASLLHRARRAAVATAAMALPLAMQGCSMDALGNSMGAASHSTDIVDPGTDPGLTPIMGGMPMPDEPDAGDADADADADAGDAGDAADARADAAPEGDAGPDADPSSPF